LISPKSLGGMMKKLAACLVILVLVPLLMASQKDLVKQQSYDPDARINLNNPRTAAPQIDDGRALGDVLMTIDLAAIGVPGSYSGAGLTWDGTYLYYENQTSHLMYVIDPTGPSVVTSWSAGLPHAWGVGSEANLWVNDALGMPGMTYEYTWGGTPTGNSFPALSGGASWMGDMSEWYTPGEIAILAVGGTNMIYTFTVPGGTPTGSIGDPVWTSISQRALTYDPYNHTFWLGGWNDGIVWEVDANTGAVLRQFTPADDMIAGLAYDWQSTLHPTPVLWLTTNTLSNYIYMLDADNPNPAPAAFWDFETGWQGWTHTSVLTFPAAWDVVTTTYPGGPYWTYQAPPDAGDSAFIIDSDSDYGANWVHDTAMSPPVANPGFAFLKWGFYLRSDDLWVLLREHDGSVWGSWSEVASYSGTTGPQWDSVDVSGYTGDSLQVGFRYDDLGYWGYGATFDNVGFYLPPEQDVGVAAILEPVGTYSLNDVVTPQAQVRNYGDTDETFPVIFTMTHNAILVYADTVDMTLLSGAVDTAIFTSYALDETGTYDIVSYTQLAGDMDPGNDTAYATAIIFEWVEDFESTNGSLVPAPMTGAWEWGVPTSGPGAAHSGTQLWATILAGSYYNYANWTLTSQDYYEATQDNPLISFYHWYDIETGWDGGNVKYSTDNGATWLLLHPAGGYDGVASTANSGIPAESCFTGHPAVWEAEEVIIPVTSGQNFKLRFHFGTDGSVTYPGWYIDDLAGLGCSYVGIEEEPGSGHVAVFGFAPSMSTVHRNHVPIAYSTTAASHVSLKVYDNTGRLVRTLVDAQQPAGEKAVLWDNKDLNKRVVANGVYFLKLEAEGKTDVQKLIFVH
jgi:hypothetical protein